jgi:hypothetical protein
MYSSLRNQGLRIINYMINGRLIARLPVKVPMMAKRNRDASLQFVHFCFWFFCCKGAHVGMPVQEIETVVSTYSDFGECINICMCNLISTKHISDVNTLRRVK